MKTNIEVFYKGILFFSVFISRHAQSTQNNNFAKSLLYIKTEGRNKVDFWHADKHQTFIKDDAINFGGQGKSCTKRPKLQVSKIFAISQEKKGGMKLIFCMQINIKLFKKMMLPILVDKASHAQSTQISKFPKPLQCLKKEVKDKVAFWCK